MFAADAELEVRPGLPAIFNGNPDEPPDTVSIQHLKRVVGKDTMFDLRR
jgi:hypothetical protein